MRVTPELEACLLHPKPATLDSNPQSLIPTRNPRDSCSREQVRQLLFRTRNDRRNRRRPTEGVLFVHRLEVVIYSGGWVPREQKMLKGHLPRVICYQVYWYEKKIMSEFSFSAEIAQKNA